MFGNMSNTLMVSNEFMLTTLRNDQVVAYSKTENCLAASSKQTLSNVRCGTIRGSESDTAQTCLNRTCKIGCDKKQYSRLKFENDVRKLVLGNNLDTF